MLESIPLADVVSSRPQSAWVSDSGSALIKTTIFCDCLSKHKIANEPKRVRREESS